MALTKIKTGGLTDNSVTDAKVADAITVTGTQTGITQVGTLTALTTGAITQNAGVFTIKNASGDSNGLRIFQDSSDASKIYNNYNGTLQLGVGNTTALTIDSSENSTFAGDVNVSATKTLFLDGASGHTFISEYSANKMQLQAGGQGSVILDGTNSGEIRMGVGTSSPDSKIHAKVTTDSSETIRLQNDDTLSTLGVSSDGYSFLTYQSALHIVPWDGSTWGGSKIIVTSSGRIAQEISEGSAYAATFENTHSGGYGLRAYGGASWADNALWIADKDGNEAFAVKSNGITVSDGKVRQAYVSATYPQDATTTRTFNIMTLLGHSAGTPYGLVELLFTIYTNGGNTDCETHRVTFGGYGHTGYNEDLAWNLIHEVLDAGSTNSAISSITLTGTGGDLNIAYANGDSNDDAYLRGIMRGWGA